MFESVRRWIRRQLRERTRRQIRDSALASGAVRICVYDMETAYRDIATFERLDPPEQLFVLRCATPKQVLTDTNTTVKGLDKLRVDNLDENQSIDEKAVECAVGNDNTAPAYTNTSLNNEVARVDIASTEDQTTDLKTTSVVDTNTANGKTLNELGLISEGDRLLNHSTFTGVNKTSSISVTLEVTLSFSAK